jgi:hypothetical protein
VTPAKLVRLAFVVLMKTRKLAVDLDFDLMIKFMASRTGWTMERVWRAIEDGHSYPAPWAMQCLGCPFCDADRWRSP